jgi:hypothetical protein
MIEPDSVANRQSQENRGEKRWPPTGRNPGRQWGVSVAASGEVLMAAVSLRIIRACSSPSGAGRLLSAWHMQSRHDVGAVVEAIVPGARLAGG